MTKLNIEQTNNGFILSWEEDWSSEDKDDVKIEKKVLEEDCYSEKEEHKTMDSEKILVAKLLYEVAEHFGENYDKFSDSNLRISFDKKGHKLE